MQDAHAGEIMLCSIDRDCTMEGYDVDLIAQVAARLEVPLIASSGAGMLQHCQIKVRTYLATNGESVRSQKGSHS
jgi:cyclase